MSSLQDVIHSIANPTALGFIITLFLVVTIPIILHQFVFRASGLITLPSILLLGPSGSGKTSLLTLVSIACKAVSDLN
jgi:signal recognition particle receptor subunit beta